MLKDGIVKIFIVTSVLIFISLSYQLYSFSAETTSKVIIQEDPSGNNSTILVKETSVEEAFKKTLEYNEKLRNEKADLEKKIDELRMQLNLYANRINTLTTQLDTAKKDLEKGQDAFEEKRKKLANQLEGQKRKEKLLRDQIRSLRRERNKNMYYILYNEANSQLMRAEGKLRQVEKDYQKLMIESGKMHYNMANILFKDGDYKQAAYEYEYALKMLPYDPDICYNLAIIYDNYLNDSKQAAYYYKLYVQKSPKDKDGDSLWIKEKIAEKTLESKVLENSKSQKSQTKRRKK
jgi:tetratricopeptide (TPR) repeat protein